MILSIDTTSEFGSLALTDARGTQDEFPLHSPDGFGHVLFGAIEQFLAGAGVRVGDLEAFGVANGPGSFTGVRVGLAAVKGLAEATGRPLVTVSNLQALAVFGSADLRATVLDARRGDIYGGLYDAALNPLKPEAVMKFAAWMELLPQGVELIGFAADAAIPVTAVPEELAGAVGRIAWDRFKAGLAIDPLSADANYVRRSDAELFWKDV